MRTSAISVIIVASNVLLWTKEVAQAEANTHHHKRILNGTFVTYEQYPFYVYYKTFEGEKFEWTCGGALITSHWFITARHCFWFMKGSASILIYHAADDGQPNSTLVDNYKIHDHPQADISLVQLTQPLSNAVSTLRLPRPFEDEGFIDTGVKTTLVAAGGPVDERLGLPSVKQIVLSVSRVKCPYMSSLWFDLYYVCNYQEKAESFMFSGDSGSPIFATTATGKVILATVSNLDHDGSAPESDRSYLIRVSSIMNWILHTANVNDSLKEEWMGLTQRKAWNMNAVERSSIETGEPI